MKLQSGRIIRARTKPQVLNVITRKILKHISDQKKSKILFIVLIAGISSDVSAQR